MNSICFWTKPLQNRKSVIVPFLLGNNGNKSACVVCVTKFPKEEIILQTKKTFELHFPTRITVQKITF